MKTHSKLKLLGCLPAENAQDALGNGTITEADIDERLRVQFNVRMQLGKKNTPSFEPFNAKNDHFAKTGSGQS